MHHLCELVNLVLEVFDSFASQKVFLVLKQFLGIVAQFRS
jgi:hypothetical protein